MPSKLLMGNEAFAWAALEAGVRVVAGYPGTPSSELIETVARLHAQGIARGVHVEWSTNEKAALEVLAGASASGARALFTCKQVGLNVASDALMSLNYVGVRGGLVLYVADDPGPISSQTEQDTRRFADFAKVPVLDPATPDQGYEMMHHAFDLSEKYATPVIVRPTTRICHASTFFEMPSSTTARPIPEGGFERDSKWVIFPRRSYQAHGEINRRLPDIAAQESRGVFNPSTECGTNSQRGIVAGGVSVQYVKEALSRWEQRLAAVGKVMPAYKFMQVGTPFPFPEEAALRFIDGLSELLVFEELDSVIEDGLLALVGAHHLSVDIKGRRTGDTLDRGENTVEDAETRLGVFLGLTDLIEGESAASFSSSSSASSLSASSPSATSRSSSTESSASSAHSSSASSLAEEVHPPLRPPVLCAGCPHRGAFFALKHALRGRKHVFCGDIGCYTLGNAKPLEAVDTCLCMGAGITMAQGMATVEPDRACVAFIGDSTFFASGLTGIANAVYNQHDITVCVLDNSTTAMTGGQPHPGTGTTLMGQVGEAIDIEGVLRALGMKCVTRANPLYVRESVKAAKEALDFKGPSAVLFESPCTQIVPPEPAALVDPARCTACRVCIESIGCPAMSMIPRADVLATEDAPASGNVPAASDASAADGTSAVGSLPTTDKDSAQSSAPAASSHNGKAAQAYTSIMNIDPTLCYGCGLCVDVCPYHAISAEVRNEGRLPFAQACEKGRLRLADSAGLSRGAQQKEGCHA